MRGFKVPRLIAAAGALGLAGIKNKSEEVPENRRPGVVKDTRAFLYNENHLLGRWF